MTMDFDDYRRHDATALADLVRRGEVTPAELLRLALDRTDAVNDRLTAVVLRFDDEARRQAKGKLDGAFAGVPFLLKDLGAEHRDYPAHNGSRLLQDTHHDHDSEMVLRLLRAGLVIFGRTAAPEGGIGAVTEAVVYGAPTRNPWDLTRTPGGSSGGAGAAVASGIIPAAHGSDGGGSVRIPASSCGLFGFKPSRAILPEGPIAGEGWAGMATDGFLTRSVRDTAGLLDATAGPDLGAPYAAPDLGGTYGSALKGPTPTLRVALCSTRFDGSKIDAEVAEATRETARLLRDMGHRVDEARPEADHAGMMRAWCDIVACGTALSVRGALRRLGRDLREDDLEPLSRAAIEHARGVSGADYLAAVSRIHLYTRQMAPFLQRFDILLTPTLAEPPAEIGRLAHDRDDFLDYRLGKDGIFAYSPFTAAFNATGQPAMSVPLCWTEGGLPLGMHFAAAFGRDRLLMSLAADLERARPWFDRVAPL